MQSAKVTAVQGNDKLLNSTYPSALRDGLAKRVRDTLSSSFSIFLDNITNQAALILATRSGAAITDADLVACTSSTGMAPARFPPRRSFTCSPSLKTGFVAPLCLSLLSESGLVKPVKQLVEHPAYLLQSTSPNGPSRGKLPRPVLNFPRLGISPTRSQRAHCQERRPGQPRQQL